MKLWCPVCEKEFPIDSGHLVCPNSGDKGVHVLDKKLNYARLPSADTYKERFSQNKNAYLVFKEILSSWQIASLSGTEAFWNNSLATIDERAGKLFGRALEVTPLVSAAKLETTLGLETGTVFAKNETVNLTGSHKSRHHIGTILYLKTLQHKNNEPAQPCAVFSCGNSALGAGALAYSAKVPLYAFVPEHVNETITESLVACGTTVVKVQRDTEIGQGDPCYNRYKEALRTFGWSPLSCYAHDLWPGTEGAEVLALELCLQAPKLDALLVQVGGSGLAHGVWRGIKYAKAMGIISKLPKLFLVQTAKCYPLLISYINVLTKLCVAANIKMPTCLGSNNYLEIVNDSEFKSLEKLISLMYNDTKIQKAVREIAANRQDYFKPWPFAFELSVAEGIMDDTTYDGLESILGVLESGGSVEILSEIELETAQNLAQTNLVGNISATGSAGLAGFLKFKQQKAISSKDKVGILLTGVETRSTIKNSASLGKVVNLASTSNIDSIL